MSTYHMNAVFSKYVVRNDKFIIWRLSSAIPPISYDYGCMEVIKENILLDQGS